MIYDYLIIICIIGLVVTSLIPSEKLKIPRRVKILFMRERFFYITFYCEATGRFGWFTANYIGPIRHAETVEYVAHIEKCEPADIVILSIARMKKSDALHIQRTYSFIEKQRREMK